MARRSPQLSAINSLLPTPVSRDYKGDTPGRTDKLAGAIDALLPTPNASDGSGGGQHSDRREGHSRQLSDYALLLQTPSAADARRAPQPVR